MSNLGTELEQLVKAIQETIKDRTGISTHTNVKIEDDNGIKREIDVLVEDFSISPCHRIAFECKNYKKKVDIQIVDAVIGKFLDISHISKIIIVSTQGYTDNAKKKAQKHNIELCSLSKFSIDDTLLNNIPILSTTMETTLLDVFFVVDANTNILHISDTRENLMRYQNLFISNPPEYDNIKLCELGNRFAEKNLQPIEDFVTLEFLHPYYICDKNGERLKLKKVLFKVRISINAEEGKLQEQRMMNKDDNSEIVTAKYKINDSYSMVTINAPNVNSTYLETKDKHLHKPVIFLNDFRK